ncbi:phosphatidate phosphatase PAH2-like [Pyrus ussuriensis x Pyrus communis]|uniref:Phosphatidate phosphatase PAH2-like n=1 Tax=Pyrus ussuriensis x Pyrus communis TaxID=2448454 RepID=A0A5N5H1K4_9ROSA|nr:phosphatidate phosphatase PAH2-like [Pyrus ussuriensis x Pyrus communis]
MYAVGRLGSYISRGVVQASGPFHPFGGAVDIIVVEQQDGSFKSSAWNVKFGKFQGVLKTKEKVVIINVNGEDASCHMYLDHKGEAYFLREVDAEEGEAVLYPSSSSDETDEQCRENGQPLKSMSCNYDAENLTPVDQIETLNGKILSRTNSRRSRIFGLFGSRSMKERKSKEEEGVDSEVRRVDSLKRAEFAANLLEVKWSTSLATKKFRKDNASRFSSPNMLVNEDMQIDAEESRLSSSLPVSRVSSDVGESFIAATEQDGNAIAVISNVTGSDLEIQSSFELEACPGKHLDEKDVVLPGCDISHAAGGIDGVQPFIYCETLYIARERSGQVHVHARTELLSKDSVTEQHADNTSMEVHSVEATEICSQETDAHSCTDCNIDLDGPAIVQQCNIQTVQQNSLPDSVQKVESQSMSSLSTSCDRVQEEENIEEEDVASCDLQTPYKSVNGHVVTEAASVLPVRLEEEQFLFSDDEIRVTEVQCTESHFPSCVGGENSLLCSPKDGTNYESYSSLEKFIPEDPSTDFQKSTGKLKAASAAVGIPRNHTAAAGKEVGRLVESLPIMWPQTDKLTALDLHYPLSHSLDSNVHPLKSIWQCKDDLSFRKFDREEEQQLALETPDSENASGSAELKDGPACSAVGDPSKANVAASGSWKLWPFGFRGSNSRTAMQPDVNGSKSPEAENASESTVGTDGDKNMLTPKGMKKMERALAPTSEQLASLKLKEGKNTVTFTFFTAMLGKQQVDARIYLWKWNTRIVISDVDGTITKSDVLGQFMPLVGVDWSHVGVTHLFSAIKENGYQLLFLSARAISQASLTRHFLFNLKQDGKALPDGPVVISPDGLFPSLFREVIRRAPHEFKIACLEDIKSLFPSDCNPFYAGFGNRDTDEFSYLKVGIPKGKIFIINPKGEVAVNRRVDTKSYSSLHALVNGMFPSTNSSEQEDFNTWNFWKLPLPDINV